MKLDGLKRRIEAMEPCPGPDPDEVEHEAVLMQAFEEHFLARLKEMGCPEILEGTRAALGTVGPRPFGHTRPDDRPVWVVINKIEGIRGDLAYRIRAAESLAWAGVYSDLGEPEDGKLVRRYRTMADRDLEQDKKEKQTFCDGCGQPLGRWWCLVSRGKAMIKICRSCEAVK